MYVLAKSIPASEKKRVDYTKNPDETDRAVQVRGEYVFGIPQYRYISDTTSDTTVIMIRNLDTRSKILSCTMYNTLVSVLDLNKYSKNLCKIKSNIYNIYIY